MLAVGNSRDFDNNYFISLFPIRFSSLNLLLTFHSLKTTLLLPFLISMDRLKMPQLSDTILFTLHIL